MYEVGRRGNFKSLELFSLIVLRHFQNHWMYSTFAAASSGKRKEYSTFAAAYFGKRREYKTFAAFSSGKRKEYCTFAAADFGKCKEYCTFAASLLSLFSPFSEIWQKCIRDVLKGIRDCIDFLARKM